MDHDKESGGDRSKSSGQQQRAHDGKVVVMTPSELSQYRQQWEAKMRAMSGGMVAAATDGTPAPKRFASLKRRKQGCGCGCFGWRRRKREGRKRRWWHWRRQERRRQRWRRSRQGGQLGAKAGPESANETIYNEVHACTGTHLTKGAYAICLWLRVCDKCGRTDCIWSNDQRIRLAEDEKKSCAVEWIIGIRTMQAKAKAEVSPAVSQATEATVLIQWDK